jgi:hypothetical protein
LGISIYPILPSFFSILFLFGFFIMFIFTFFTILRMIVNRHHSFYKLPERSIH